MQQQPPHDYQGQLRESRAGHQLGLLATRWTHTAAARAGVFCSCSAVCTSSARSLLCTPPCKTGQESQPCPASPADLQQCASAQHRARAGPRRPASRQAMLAARLSGDLRSLAPCGTWGRPTGWLSWAGSPVLVAACAGDVDQGPTCAEALRGSRRWRASMACREVSSSKSSVLAFATEWWPRCSARRALTASAWSCPSRSGRSSPTCARSPHAPLCTHSCAGAKGRETGPLTIKICLDCLRVVLPRQAWPQPAHLRRGATNKLARLCWCCWPKGLCHRSTEPAFTASRWPCPSGVGWSSLNCT